MPSASAMLPPLTPGMMFATPIRNPCRIVLKTAAIARADSNPARRKWPNKNGSRFADCRSIKGFAAYCSLAKVSLIASKFGRSFGVGVCSLYFTTPSLSMTNAARAATEPKPIKSSSNTP